MSFRDALKKIKDLDKIEEEHKPLEDMTHVEYEASNITIEWKTRTGRIIYIVPSLAILESKRKEGQAWFLPEDVRTLKGKSPEMVEKIIDILEVYPRAKIKH